MTVNKDDATLVQKAKRDPQQFTALYEKYAEKVFNYFWYRTGHDKMLAEDLTQETFLRAFNHLQSYRNRGYSYLTYLLTIAHNILVDHFRKPATVPLNTAPDVPIEIIRDIERRSDVEALWKALQTLPRHQRDKLLMRYHLGMPIQDIARATRSTENAVKLALSRARKKLRDHPFLQADIAAFGEVHRPPRAARFLTR